MARVISSAGQKPRVGPDAIVGFRPGMGCSSWPVAQQRVGVGGVQRLGAGGEVEHARRAVGDDQRHGQGGEDAAVPEAEEEELDVGAHRTDPLALRPGRPSGTSPREKHHRFRIL